MADSHIERKCNCINISLILSEKTVFVDGRRCVTHARVALLTPPSRVIRQSLELSVTMLFTSPLKVESWRIKLNKST